MKFRSQELSNDVFTFVVAPWERRPRLATNQIYGTSVDLHKPNTRARINRTSTRTMMDPFSDDQDDDNHKHADDIEQLTATSNPKGEREL